MAIIRLQGDKERSAGIYYEFDDSGKALGEGGMGKVFRGRRVNFRTQETRDVAIKFLFAGLPPNVIQRAQDEAQIHIINDNLVEMMGFLAVESQMPNGTKTVRYHVVSELLIGVSLSDLLNGVVTDQNGKVIPFAEELYKLHNTSPVEFAVKVMKRVLAGLLALHDAGYIHRDLDPSNIMITTDGKIKIIDFGISKKVDGLKTHDRNLTTAGQFMGKPQYAAPELILGDLKNQNKPTDIYAAGILFFQLLTGHLPFEGPSNVVLNAHIHSKIPLKQIKDKNLRRIIGRATEKDGIARYQSAAEFRVDLDSMNSSKITTVIDRKWLMIGVGALFLIVLGICIWQFIPKSNTDTEAAPAGQTLVKHEGQDKGSNGNPSVSQVRKMLLNPEEAEKGLERLTENANNGDVESKFILSRLYAVSLGSFVLADDYVTMQANLQGSISQDAAKAHTLLKEIVQDNPDYYPALYELACDYYEGKPLSGSDERSLSYAKTLLDKAYQYADNSDDVVYKNKISSLLRKY